MNKLTDFNRVLRHTAGAVVVLLGVVLGSGCVENIDPEGMKDDNVTMTLRLDEAFQEMAYVRVNHDGGQEDLWYYMCTSELDTDAQLELETRIASLLAKEGKIQGNVGVNRSVTIKGLEANRVYRVIAAIVTPAGEISGKVAELTFKTMRNPDVFEPHPSWKVEYKERRVAEDNPDDEKEVIICTAGDTLDTYVPYLLPADYFRSQYKGNYRTCFESYVAECNAAHKKWAKEVKKGDCTHLEERLVKGDYLLFMIGIDSTGTLTGYYAETLLKLEQEPATEAYNKWIGNDWKLTGKCDGKEITYEVKIVPEENNLYYQMYGWESTTVGEGFRNVPEDLPILLYFEKSTGDMYVMSQQLDDLDNPALADLYDFFVYGCIKVDYSGTMMDVPVDIPFLKVARFTMNADGSAKATPLRISLQAFGIPGEQEFLYFNYSYMMVGIYNGLIPVTMDSMVPRINTLKLTK